MEGVVKILEEALNFPDIPARPVSDVGGRIALPLEVDDCTLGIILAVQQPLMYLVGLRQLAS